MKQVYVLGAGASAASADTPLGRDLVWNYHLDCGLLVPINNGVPDLREENENFKNFRTFLELCASIYPELRRLPEKWDARGEEMFDLYGRIEKRHYVDELLEILHGDARKNDIELVRKLIFEHLVQSSFGNQNLLYKRFIAEILKNRSPQDTSIIPHESYGNLIEFLWSIAEEELRHAKTVTVIGYSFPEYDKRVLDLFVKSIGPKTKLHIVNYCSPNEDKSRKKRAISTKFRNLFPSLEAEIEVHLDGFKGYIDTYTS